MRRSGKATSKLQPRGLQPPVLREWLMKSIRYFLGVTAMLCLVLPATMRAQSAAASFDLSPPPDPTEGKIQDNYVIHQSLEMGWQQTSVGGNGETYGTFVDLDTGFRLFDQTLQMRSLNHKGAIFDTLWASSFGYGGDPNNASRLRMSKDKWYDFNASFRRDYQRWDYDLWGNPLNPPNITAAGTPNPAFPAETALDFSPHMLDTVRRNADFNLTIAPQSRVDLRLGYNRMVLEGPDTTSIHGFADALLYQQVRTIQDTYQIGFDVRVIPRTVISYTQFIQNYKQDSWAIDQNLAQVFGVNTPYGRSLYNPLAAIDPVTGTTAVDIGLPISTFANQPCASPFTGTHANPTCSTYTFYGSGSIVNGALVNPGPRTNPIADFFPTEQFSLHSNYFKNVDFTAHAAYSNSQVDWSWNELNVGLGRGPTGSTVRTDQLAGPGANNRVDVNADGAVTWRATDRIQISDTFTYNNFRLPGSRNETETTYAAATASLGLNSPLAATPVVALSAIANYLDMKVKSNLADVAVDLTRRVGGHLGYRFTDRRYSETDFLNGVLAAAGAESGNGFVPIHENSGLLGLWARPRDNLRMNLDLEVITSSPGDCSAAAAASGLCTPGQATITRMSPNHLQHYNFRTRWAPQPWLTLTGSVNILESRDNQSASSLISLPINVQHNRNFGFAATISKSSNWSVDFGYNYSDVFSTTAICFAASPLAPGTLTGTCPTDMQSQGQPFLSPSFYRDLTHDGYVNAMVKPFRRTTFMAGYDIMSVSGTGLLLAAFANPTTTPATTIPLSSLGTQDYIYHRPSLGMAVELSKVLTWKTTWRYYDYNEGAQNPFAPTLPRNFNAHVVDLALRYAF